MKKTLAAIALGLMLLGAGTAWADPSPEGDTISGNKDPETEGTIDGNKEGDPDGKTPDKGTRFEIPDRNISPKTADFPVVYVEGFGVLLAGAAAAAAMKSRRYA